MRLTARSDNLAEVLIPHLNVCQQHKCDRIRRSKACSLSQQSLSLREVVGCDADTTQVDIPWSKAIVHGDGLLQRVAPLGTIPEVGIDHTQIVVGGRVIWIDRHSLAKP